MLTQKQSIIDVNCTSHVTVTKTVYFVPTGTGVFATGKPSHGTNGTLATATPTQTGVFSAGVKNTMDMGATAVLVWVGLAAGVLLFA
jgi:hypothetical protein